MVRDPGNRFHGTCLIRHIRRENQQVPKSPMGQTNHETPKTNQATVEPSGVLRDFLATLCRESLQHPKMSNVILQVQIVLPTLSACLCQSAGTTETRMTAQAPCIKTGRKQACLAQYRITSSKLESFLARYRPVLQFELF